MLRPCITHSLTGGRDGCAAGRRCGATLASANVHNVANFGDEYLTVARLAGGSAVTDGVDHGLGLLVVDDDRTQNL
jgi:hypothetical protein